MMRHLAFLPYPAYGHMMPALPVIAELVARGHRVSCFTNAEFTGKVAATGASALLYDPPLSSDPPPDIIDADECARAPLKLLNASTAVLPSIESTFTHGPPDAVVYDTTLWLTGRLLAARWHRPSIQLSPTFVSNEYFSLSSEHERYTGRVDPDHPAITEFTHRLTEVISGSGLPEDRQAELFLGHEEFTVAFLPRAFQFAGETFDEHHVFVGPTADRHDDTTWPAPPGGAPQLLVSLGTTVNNRPGFFRQCVTAFAELPWHTVLALGGRVDVAELGPLPANVEAHQWVPMPAALAQTSALLCQSGMGSIMQALRAGVPMVVVPHHPEQHVNAHRLSEFGLARVVQREDVTPETLRAAVLDVAVDAGMRGRVRAMQQQVRSAGGATRAADVIEQRLRAVSMETS